MTPANVPSTPEAPAAQAAQAAAAPSGQAGGDAPAGAKSSRERALIEGAIAQAQPRSGSGSFFSLETLPHDTFPGYEIQKEIHRGGQGIVYQAIQKTTKRRVAVKVVKDGPFSGTSDRLRFEREVQVLGQLQHPNIVTIHDSGHVHGYFFYVMDYISGQPLDQWVAGGASTASATSKNGKTRSGSGSRHARGRSSDAAHSIDDLLRVFGRVCSAVSAAHMRGVVHRDLKPGNIRVDTSGEPHVLDFGLAKLAGDSRGAEGAMTVTGQFVGSLPWASPEQAEGAPEKIDIRTDVYSLGVILYQMLTGRFPYEVVGNIRDILDNILRAQPAKPSTVRRQINDEVETIILKCLSKERERRYQSAGELERDIVRYLAGEPIEAKRDSGWYVITKALRRYKLPAAGAAVFVLTVTVLAAVMTVLYKQKSAAEALARTNAEQLKIQLLETERQKTFAEAGLDATRTLARTMLVDFAKRIDTLRGATPAKLLLRERALDAVARLREQARDDDGFRRVLASALEQAADIHAGLTLSGVGKTDAAAASLAEAWTMRDSLRTRHPSDAWSHADAGENLVAQGRLALIDRRFTDARDLFDRAIDALDTALARVGGAGVGPSLGQATTPPSAPAKGENADLLALRDARRRAQTGRADATWAISEALEKAGKTAEAADSARAAAEVYADAARTWRERVRQSPGDTDVARQAGVVADKHASVLASWGQALLTRANARRAAFGAGGGAAEPGDGQGPGELALAALGKFDESIAVAQGAADAFAALAKEQPASGAIASDIVLAQHNIGAGHMWAAKAIEAAQGVTNNAQRPPDVLARLRAARDALARGAAVGESLVRSDESNLINARDLALVLNKLGNVHKELFELDEAADAYARSLTIRRDLVRTDPTPQSRRDLALGLVKSAQIMEERGRLGEAIAAYVEAERTFRDLAEGSPDAAADADRVRSRREEAERKLRESGGS